MAEVKDLLAALVDGKQEQDARMAEQAARMAEQDARMAELLAAIKNPPAPAAATVRAEQVMKITSNINKSKRLKPFKVTQDIKLFLKLFDEELINMKAAVGLDDPLAKEEWVPIFQILFVFLHS